jgi:alcohol dehydrogenase
MKFGLNIPTRLQFGAGELKNLATMPLPGKKALIVISAGSSMKRFGYLSTLEEQLDKAGIGHVTFDKILPNPIKSHVMEGAELCRTHACDFVIGLGGGSSIDTAKAIAVTVAMGGDFWQYVAGGTGGGQPIERALPIVAIPTTAGTGTEVDLWSVITNEQTQEKIGWGSPLVFPTLAVVDPELMMSVPPRLTAYQGFDAFFHAAEGYISKAHTPISDLYALEAIRLLYKYLPVAVADPKNRWARIKVAWASTLAGMVESTSCCTGEHALEHAMSAFFPKLPHGAGLIAISQAYFKTFKNDMMKRYMKMAEKMTQQKAARPSDFLDALAIMQRECGVDDIRLSEYGITPADFERMADNACATGQAMLDLDPRFLNREELIDIYMQSYK